MPYYHALVCMYICMYICMYVCHIMLWYVCMSYHALVCMYVILCFGMYVRHIMLWYVCTSYYYTLLIKIKIKINRTGNILRPYLHCILIYDHHVHQILASCPTFYQSTLFIHKTFLFVFVFTWFGFCATFAPHFQCFCDTGLLRHQIILPW